MKCERDNQLTLLFETLKKVVHDAQPLDSYDIFDKHTLQKIQGILEKIALLMMPINEKVHKYAISTLQHLLTRSSEQYLIKWSYDSVSLENEDRLEEVVHFLSSTYKIRNEKIYLAAQRHSHSHVRWLLMLEGWIFRTETPIAEIKYFLQSSSKLLRSETLDTITEYAEREMAQLYVELLKNRDVYEYWGKICEALIEIGVPAEAVQPIIEGYFFAVEQYLKTPYPTDGVFQTLLDTLLIYYTKSSAQLLSGCLEDIDLSHQERAERVFSYIDSETLRNQMRESYQRIESFIQEWKDSMKEEEKPIQPPGSLKDNRNCLLSINDRKVETGEVFRAGYGDIDERVRREALKGMIRNRDPFLYDHYADILQDTYHNKALLLLYFVKHKIHVDYSAAVEQLFNAQAKQLLSDDYVFYLSSVMKLLSMLKNKTRKYDRKSNMTTTDKSFDSVFVSIFDRFPKPLKFKMLKHVDPFVIHLVMDFIIEETGQMEEGSPHYSWFTYIVTRYFSWQKMKDLLPYLDTSNDRLMSMAVEALGKRSNQNLRI